VVKPLPSVVRPRIASVIGVIWVFLGSAWVAGGLLGTLAWINVVTQLPPGVAMGPSGWLFPAYTLALVCLGGFGAHSAGLLLRLDPSSVPRLRFLNYGVIALLAAVGFLAVVPTKPPPFGSAAGASAFHGLVKLGSFLGAVIGARRLGRSAELRSALLTQLARQEAARQGSFLRRSGGGSPRG
jgi:hypothetical protein